MTQPAGSGDDVRGATSVERLGAADAGEVLTLQRAAYVTEAQLHDDPALPPLTETLDEIVAALADPHTRVLGIRADGRLVATVRLEDLGAGRVALGRLAVAPDRQGHGLGSLLLAAGERAFPGTRAMELFTGERSERNLALYRRQGYTETRRTPAGNHHLVHLIKYLPPA
jgi:GNAT superfamily N-acetyltransferase